MKTEAWHTFIVAFVVLLAIVILKHGGKNAVPTGVLNIAEAAQVPPSSYSNLPGYIAYNLSPWGPVMQPMIDTTMGDMSATGSTPGNSIYGPYYNT
ncbi:MAG: hypothetical protein P4N59_13115 [Negativicutes bacterium]|nr:hypothetical protein [Negativicutes bacterium]